MEFDFNEISQDKRKPKGKSNRRYGEDALQRAIRTGERPRFVHKPNPLIERDFQIYEYNYEVGEYKHVGDYVLLQMEESRELTEKKVSNLMDILNKKDNVPNISNLTKNRVLFTIVPEAQAGDQTKIIYKDYDGSGVSKDNAIFTIRKGVLS